jgi:hypothetical protein
MTGQAEVSRWFEMHMIKDLELVQSRRREKKEKGFQSDVQGIKVESIMLN